MRDFLSALGTVLLALVASLAYAGLLRADEQIVYWGPVDNDTEVAHADPSREPTLDHKPTAGHYVPSFRSEWTINGRPWTRARLLSHLQHDGIHRTIDDRAIEDLPLAELRAIHNANHEQTLDVPRLNAQVAKQSATETRRTVAERPAPTARLGPPASYCPSGSCPTFRRSTMRHRPGLFGRRR